MKTPALPWTAEPDRRRGGWRDALRLHGARVALGIGLALGTYALFPAAPAVESPVLEVGAVAPANVIAPFAFDVRKAPAELAKERDELAATVQPIFVLHPEVVDSVRRRIAAFRTAITSAAASASAPALAAPAVQQAAGAASVALTPVEASYVATPRNRDEILRAVERVMERWLPAGVAATGALDDVPGRVTIRRGDEERSLAADSITTFGMLLPRARQLSPDPASPVGDGLFVKLVSAFFQPTLVFDRIATTARREDLRRAAEAVKYQVRAGEKIVGAHEVVGREEHDKMRALDEELAKRTRGERDAGRVAGAVLFNAMLIALLGIALLLFRPQLYKSMRSLALFAIVFLLVLGAASAIGRFGEPHPELIPIALAAVIFSVLFDPRISMIAAMILAVLVGGQSVFRGTNALYLNLIGGVAAAFSVRIIRRRNQSYYSILTIAVAYLLAAVAIGLTLDQPGMEILESAMWGALNAVVSVSLAMLLLGPAEELTGVDTYLKLLEWSDLNRPLMQRLMVEAPGTYNHTIVMANLAEAACNAIGANGLLARVGAYYHDIGKLKKPEYFVENQQGRNPHDKLKPSTSAAIIRDHVKAGLELADEHRLPKAVRAFIVEHHGTGSISYFLEKAKERDGAPVNPGEYAYPGPRPQSAETAVLMLADGVEASTRVLNDPTPQQIRDVIDHIVKMRIDQGQLRDAPLTLRQIEIAKEQFARILLGQYHRRIDYPASSGGVTSEFAAV